MPYTHICEKVACIAFCGSIFRMGLWECGDKGVSGAWAWGSLQLLVPLSRATRRALYPWYLSQAGQDFWHWVNRAWMNSVKDQRGLGGGLLSLDGRKFCGFIFAFHTAKVSNPQSNNAVHLHHDLVFWKSQTAQCAPMHSVIFGSAWGCLRSRTVHGAPAIWRSEVETDPGPPAFLPHSVGGWGSGGWRSGDKDLVFWRSCANQCQQVQRGFLEVGYGHSYVPREPGGQLDPLLLQITPGCGYQNGWMHHESIRFVCFYTF